MTRSKKVIFSAVASMGTFFCLNRAYAQQYTVSPNLAPVGSGALVNGVTYGDPGTTTTSGFDEITNVNTSYAVGFQRSTGGSNVGALVWDTNLSIGTPIYIGFQTDNFETDSSVTVNPYAKYDATGTLAFNYPATSTLASAPQAADFYLLTTGGVVGGGTTRNFISGTTNTARGTDAWIYTPTVNTLDGGVGQVYTPTVVNPQTSIADTNGDGITSYYYYTTASDPVNDDAGTIQAVNNASQAVGISSRYTGTTATNSLGTDTWISTQTSATAVTTQLLGLGSGAATASTGYAYTTTISTVNYVNRTSSVIPSGTVANNVGLTDSGEAAGTTNRYDDATSAGTSTNTAGLDSWVYTATNGTTQVGLTDSAGTYTVAAGNGLSNNVPFEYSKITELNPSGQVAGTSWNFGGTGGSGTFGAPQTSGWQAWVYTPSGTPTTSSALGSGGYAQVGLTDLATAAYTTPSGIGHAYSGQLPTSVSGAASVSFNGTSLYGTAANGYNLVSGLSTSDSTGNPKTGIAAGIALRFDSNGNADLPSVSGGLGQDAWVATTSGTPVTTNIQPDALIAANPSNPSIVSYYQPVVTNVYSATAKTVAPVTSPTNGEPASSVYVNASRTAGTALNPGYASMSVLGMNSSGLTAGSIVRTDNGLNIGNDLWVYDPSLNKEFILAAPAATTLASGAAANPATSYGSMTYEGISNSGVVFGLYQTSQATTITSSGTTGNYLFDWSEKTGFVTLDQLYTANNPTSSTAIYLALNNALAGTTVPSNLFANGLTLYNMFIDGSGNLYLDGNTGPLNSGAAISNGAFEVAPEPSSVTLLLLGATGLLSRRRRRTCA